MKIIELPVERKFPVEGELAERINELICEYDGQISTVAALGILEMVKQRVIGKLIINHTGE